MLKTFKIFAILFGLAFIPVVQGQTLQNQNPTGMTMDDLHQITTAHKLVLVEFFATWCGPCKIVAPIVDDVKKQMGDSFVLIKIDIDANPILKNAYRIDEIPYLMLFKNGNIEWNGIGMTTKEMLFEEMMKEVKE